MSSFALFLTTALVWGSTWLAIKGQLGVVSPIASVAYRFALAAAILLALCWKRGIPLRFGWRVHLGLLGQGASLFSLNYVCVYVMEQYVSSGLVAIFHSLLAILNVFGARLLFGTPLGLRSVFAAMLGISGITLMFFPEFGTLGRGPEVFWAMGAGVAGVLLACTGNMVAIHSQRKEIPIWSGTGWGMAYGAAVSVLAGGATGIEWTLEWSPVYLLSLLYLSVFGSIVAFLCYLTLLKREGAGLASYVMVVTPVVALLFSTLFENYEWTGVAAAGAVLAIAGNFLAMRRPEKKVQQRDHVKAEPV